MSWNISVLLVRSTDVHKVLASLPANYTWTLSDTTLSYDEAFSWQLGDDVAIAQHGEWVVLGGAPGSTLIERGLWSPLIATRGRVFAASLDGTRDRYVVLAADDGKVVRELWVADGEILEHDGDPLPIEARFGRGIDEAAVLDIMSNFAGVLPWSFENVQFRRVTRGTRPREAALADYDEVLARPEASAEQVALALFDRALSHEKRGDLAATIADYNRLIDLPDAPTYLVVMGLHNRALAHDRRGDRDAAIADYTRGVELPGTTPRYAGVALYNRGHVHWGRREAAAALADYQRVIDLPGAAAEQVVSAMFNRACVFAQLGDAAAAVAELERLRRVSPNASREEIDDDPEFDPVREDPAFAALVASWPHAAPRPPAEA